MAIGGRRRGCRRARAAVLHRVGARNAAPRPRPRRPRHRRGQHRGNTRERRSPLHQELARHTPSADQHPSRAVGDHGCSSSDPRLAARSSWARPSPKAEAMRHQVSSGALPRRTREHAVPPRVSTPPTSATRWARSRAAPVAVRRDGTARAHAGWSAWVRMKGGACDEILLSRYPIHLASEASAPSHLGRPEASVLRSAKARRSPVPAARGRPVGIAERQQAWLERSGLGLRSLALGRKRTTTTAVAAASAAATRRPMPIAWVKASPVVREQLVSGIASGAERRSRWRPRSSLRRLLPPRPAGRRGSPRLRSSRGS